MQRRGHLGLLAHSFYPSLSFLSTCGLPDQRGGVVWVSPMTATTEGQTPRPSPRASDRAELPERQRVKATIGSSLALATRRDGVTSKARRERRGPTLGGAST